MMLWFLLIVLLVLSALLFWELRVCEGAHLGSRFVVWLYDLTASRYDKIKGFDFEWEERFLGQPVAEVLSSLPDARLLDVGAGTGRLSRTLLPHWHSDGMVVNLEPSRKMLSLGKQLTQSERMPWVQAYAVPLPFPSCTFDIVANLEVLEFTPDPGATLSELIRVLHPGGWLLITNRIGWEAPWIFGHTFSRDSFASVLEEFGLQDITVYPWQMDYDLAWARKPYSAEKDAGG
jgi:ubiquinone/menaquinone biosynthesis C-methylase UbiE